MATTNWADDWEFHIFNWNQAEYLETRSAIDIRLGWDFMWETVKSINLCIWWAFIHYDVIWEWGKEERYFSVTKIQHTYVSEDKIKRIK